MTCYDAMVIGAGLSGLAAGIRLALAGKKTLIIEKHSLAGGLNSYYQHGTRTIDVGLHAMTNFCAKGTPTAPLTKMLRQLRLKYNDLDLVEQKFSAIVFPNTKLQFSNNFADFRAAIIQQFPAQLFGFDQLVTAIENHNDVSLNPVAASARQKLTEFIDNKLLREMLLCPLMYYGNAAENDMDWTQFTTMWKAIFRDGFCRPRSGMKPFIWRLLDQYKNFGGGLRLNSTVKKISGDKKSVKKIILHTGEEIAAQQIFSSIGANETAALCNDNFFPREETIGKLGFAELILELTEPPTGANESIIFFSQTQNFVFKKPQNFIDENSGVICCPANFQTVRPEVANYLRITVLANYDLWNSLGTEEYQQEKKIAASRLIKSAEKFYPAVGNKIIFQDFFTPKTIERFTGHYQGAIYGSPHKIRDGKTPFTNLFLIGTDQGFLGIIGALLSGITIANLYGIKETSI